MSRKYHKYSGKIAADVEAWVTENGLKAYDGKQVKDLITYLNIDKDTYYNWYNTIPEFKAAIERGFDAYKKRYAEKCFQSLKKAAEGGFVEEETEVTEYTPHINEEGQSVPVIRKMTRTKKKRYVKPDVGACIFVLTNLDPENYQNRQNADVTIQKKEDDMTLEEIEAELARIRKLDS